MGSASNIPNDSWHLFLKTAFSSVSATRWWSREMFYEYDFGHLHSTDKRDVTIMDWVKKMCEQNKIPDGVMIDVLAEYQIPSIECLCSNLKDDKILENIIIGFW